MTYEELVNLIRSAPVRGAALSDDDAHALIVAILVELRELREELKRK